MAKQNYTSWGNELPNLGKEPDESIAKRMGITRQSVYQMRTSRNIPPFEPKKLPALREDLGAAEIASYIKCIPLNGEQRQLITDRRIEREWSQADFARRL